jgi:hypothetical protein
MADSLYGYFLWCEEIFTNDPPEDLVFIEYGASIPKIPVDILDIPKEETVGGWMIRCYCLAHIDEPEPAAAA